MRVFLRLLLFLVSVHGFLLSRLKTRSRSDNLESRGYLTRGARRTLAYRRQDRRPSLYPTYHEDQRPSISSNYGDLQWARGMVDEVRRSNSDPDMQTIDQILTTLEGYCADRTLVTLLNRLLRVARRPGLDWLLVMLQRYQRANGIAMTQTWKSGLQIRKPRWPLAE